jgi:hypothetical protein
LLARRCSAASLQEIDQLFKIFQVMGTPHEGMWPGVSAMPDYKDTFPKWVHRARASGTLANWTSPVN